MNRSQEVELKKGIEITYCENGIGPLPGRPDEAGNNQLIAGSPPYTSPDAGRQDV